MNESFTSARRAIAERLVQRDGGTRLPLRTRLTLWYLLTLAVILALLLIFLYWQVQRSMLVQMDAALRLAASQALVGVEAEGERLVFQDTANDPVRRRLSDDFAVYLLGPDGAPWDALSRRDEFAPQAPQSGLRTVFYDNDLWRVYSEPISPAAGTGEGGWIQVAQEMEAITDAAASLRNQMLVASPLALLLAGLGGFFLAGRALQPIERITRTAQGINAGDLARRIDYRGPADEIGRLAATFNRMLDRLEAAFERERRFTGDAAHELRTPLTAMKGRIQVTLSRPRPAAAYVETLQEMEGQVDRLIHLSNDLLFMARLDQNGRGTLRRDAVSVGDLLPIVIDQVRPLAEGKGIEIDYDAPGDVKVEGDLDLLIRLFLNLLDNAVKYTPAGGKVAVTAETAVADAVITISDTGPGIPAEHLPHLFERFYRVEEARGRAPDKERQGGAGLGLAIAAEIVNVHDGRIQVKSRPGEGATFTVRLPRHK
jgi:heavy metal sensor kinase